MDNSIEHPMDELERQMDSIKKTIGSDDLYDFPEMDAPRSPENKKNRRSLYFIVFLGTTAVVVVFILVGVVIQSFGNSSVDDATSQERSPSLKGKSTAKKNTNSDEINSPPPAVENLASLCSSDSINKDHGLELCVESCKPGICCVSIEEDSTAGIFYAGENCASAHSEMCIQYEPCRNLYNRLDENDLNSLEESMEESSLPFAPLALPQICANSKDLSSCAEACKNGACCSEFSTDSCADIYPEECIGYLPCDVLDDDNTSELFCTVDNLSSKEGRKQCESICKDANCCFEKENNCKEEDICEDYKSCELLSMISASN